MPQPPPAQDARRILEEVFGYTSFRPGQEEVMAELLEGGNALAVMPTGSGKSLCFQVPALALGGLTIVVSPLIALMEDQVAALGLAGVDAGAINSSRDRAVNVATWRRAREGHLRLLYMAPERLMTEPMLEALGRLPLSLIAIDEAHCISRWGVSFRPEYENLSRLGDRFPGVPIAAFTATADEATRRDIAAKLFDGRGRVFVTGFDRPNIHLAVEARRDGPRQLLDFIEARAGDSGIVYCLSRAKTEDTAAFLADHGILALPYHAGMETPQRTLNQDRFMTEPGAVMVATIAFGMGIDKPDLRYVFHTDLPGGVEAYYQEIGRCGRDGRPAEAFMLYGLNDIRMRRMFIDQEEGADDGHRRREHKRLDALIAYCESPECRRRALLSYFGETIPTCGNCDICQDPPQVVEGTEEARKALSVVARTGQRFGMAHLIDVLRGADTEKVRRAGHDRLPTHGVGGDIAKEEWRSIFRQLVATGFLMLDVAGHGGLSITQAGRDLLGGQATFSYRRDMPGTGAGRGGKKAASKARPPATDLSAAETALLGVLKDLRLTLARERAVPAYVIFPDRALEDMARKRPRDEAQFAEVHGVGKAKLEQFAEVFLGAIDGFEE